MLQVRTAIVNGTFDDDHRDICRHHGSMIAPMFGTVSGGQGAMIRAR
jgi:hypothetical protein